MKSLTLLAKMYDLGVTASRGRPRVSNDNPYSESLFRTLNTVRNGLLTGLQTSRPHGVGYANLLRGTTNSIATAVFAL